MRWWLLGVALAVNSCVAQRMALLVGHPVEEAIATFGPPAEIDAITPSSRLYIWTKRADLKAGPAPLSRFRPVATGEFARARRRFARGAVCTFQLFARYRPDRERWIAVSMIEPAAQCT